jgi:hypothetical protein
LRRRRQRDDETNAIPAVLDHHDDAGSVRAFDAEAAMSCVLTNRTTDGMGEAHVCAAGANVTTRPMPSLRFWIITMMLVLFGLSTLKLR